jgi:hypothetical protein
MELTVSDVFGAFPAQIMRDAGHTDMAAKWVAYVNQYLGRNAPGTENVSRSEFPKSHFFVDIHEPLIEAVTARKADRHQLGEMVEWIAMWADQDVHFHGFAGDDCLDAVRKHFPELAENVEKVGIVERVLGDTFRI